MVPQTVFATVENPDLDDSIQPLTTEYVEIELQNQKDSYGYGDTIDFHVTVSDQVEGLSRIYFYWQSEDELLHEYSQEVSTYEFDIEIPVGRQWQSGTWSLTSINFDTGSSEYYGREFTDVSVVIDNDYALPVLEAMSVSPAEGSSSTTEFTFEVELQKGDAEFSEIMMDVGSEMESVTVSLTENEDGKFVGSTTFDGLSIRHLSFLMLSIDLGDETIYYTKEENNIDGVPTQVTALDFNIELTDVVEDFEAPELVEYSFRNEETELTAPVIARWDIKVKDSVTAVSSVEVVWANSDTGEEESRSISEQSVEGKEPGVTDTFTFERSFSRYTQACELYIQYISITDVQGNVAEYSVGNENADYAIDKIDVKIVNENISAEILKLSDDNLVEKLEALEEGVMAIVDTTDSIKPIVSEEENGKDKEIIVEKEVFDAIKGKDITLIFEQMSDTLIDQTICEPNGLQWIINGKDVQLTKDIDIYVHIREAEIESGWKIYQESRHENEVPRVDFDEPQFMNDLTLDAIKNAGYEDVIPQVLMLRKQGEAFYEAYHRLLSGTSYIEMLFAENGQLPGESTIRLKPAYTLAHLVGDQDVFLYFENPETDKFDEIYSDLFKDGEGYFEFDLTHNSTYALSNGIDTTDYKSLETAAVTVAIDGNGGEFYCETLEGLYTTEELLAYKPTEDVRFRACWEGDDTTVIVPDEDGLNNGGDSVIPGTSVPNGSENQSTTSGSQASASASVDTGDETMVMLYVVLMLFALATGIVIVRRKYC